MDDIVTRWINVKTAIRDAAKKIDTIIVTVCADLQSRSGQRMNVNAVYTTICTRLPGCTFSERCNDDILRNTWFDLPGSEGKRGNIFDHDGHCSLPITQVEAFAAALGAIAADGEPYIRRVAEAVLEAQGT